MTFTPLVLTDVRLYVAGADLTGYSNKIMVGAKAEALDRTTFASAGNKERVGGLFDGNADMEGFWQAGDDGQPDDLFFANLGVATVPLTAAPTEGAVADLAYLTRALETQYSPGGKVGDLAAWTANAMTNWPLVRGQILHPQGTARTSTGTGTAVQLGAVDSSHALYVTLHVLSYVDGSLTVAIDSDDNSGMSSAVTQGTFAAATALGGQTIKVAGGITDDWWRASWTITGGSTHSFLFAVAAGIGPK
jgi:hypothetical protein